MDVSRTDTTKSMCTIVYTKKNVLSKAIMEKGCVMMSHIAGPSSEIQLLVMYFNMFYAMSTHGQLHANTC